MTSPHNPFDHAPASGESDQCITGVMQLRTKPHTQHTQTHISIGAHQALLSLSLTHILSHTHSAHTLRIILTHTQMTNYCNVYYPTLFWWQNLMQSSGDIIGCNVMGGHTHSIATSYWSSTPIKGDVTYLKLAVDKQYKLPLKGQTTAGSPLNLG